MERRQIAIRNNVRIRGEGSKTLLFAHGFGCEQRIWEQVIKALPEGYKVVTFDYVGCGESDFSNYISKRYRSLKGYAQDLTEVVQTLGLTDITLVAHSVSGGIASLAYPELADKVSKIIMLNPSPRYIHDLPSYESGFSRSDVDELMVLMEQNFFQWAEYMSPKVMDNSDNPKLAETLENYFIAGDAQLTRNFAKATFYSDVRDTLPNLKCPVLILQAKVDIVVPLQVSEYMVEKLPSAKLVVMDARGHYPQLSAPQLVAQYINEFI
ncbi:MAG: alpha/beta fold hydrolase [Pseudomonadota bacterium]